MSKKRIGMIVLGVIVMLLGLLWFLQGAGIVHLNPILCVTNCKPITGKSSLWRSIGVVALVIGAVIVGACAKPAGRQKKS
jgi:hypothetical protein